MSLPSPPKQVVKASTQNTRMKEVVREDEEEVDENYNLKFIDDYVCKPMNNGFEDVIQCKSNLQEMHLCKKQCSQLGLDEPAQGRNEWAQNVEPGA